MPILCCMSIVKVPGQYYANQNKIWAFGNNAGLDFNSGVPVAIKTSISTAEGCASVSNAFGSLLFYTDGHCVYNKMGAIMPSGSSIVSFSTNSTAQGALIISVINHPNEYYLFSLEPEESSPVWGGNLFYSIIDMSLDGGFGDVSAMGVLLNDSLGEDMIAIAGNHNNIWLVTHKQDTALFLTYDITSTGVGIPIVSAAGSFSGNLCYSLSMLKASPNRKKIAQCVYERGQCYGIELYDFDASTGIISNCLSVDTLNDSYGIEFSPDNTKLYTVSSNARILYQYNIALPTSMAIQASRTEIYNSAAGGGDLKLGPDGKIYIKNVHSKAIDCRASLKTLYFI
jgi:hypothetical protein